MSCNRKTYVRCAYRGCKNTSLDVSLFRFPVNDTDRLEVWLRNTGNLSHLAALPDEKLYCRFICMVHFPPRSIHKGGRRPRLYGRAVPFPCKPDDDGTESSDQDNEIGESLRLKPPTKVYERKPPIKTYAKQNKTTTTGEAFFPSTSLSSARWQPRSDLSTKVTARPGGAAGRQKSAAESSGDRDDEGPTEASSESRNGPTCYACFGPIDGFRYSCVECVHFDLCARCEALREHAHHYMLRVPEHRPEGEVQAMLVQVRAAVGNRPPLLDCPVKVKQEPDIKCEIELEEMNSDADLFADPPHASFGALPVHPGPEDPPGDPVHSAVPEQNIAHEDGHSVETDTQKSMDNPPIEVNELANQSLPSKVKTEPIDRSEVAKRKKGRERKRTEPIDCSELAKIKKERERKRKITSDSRGTLPVTVVKIEPDVDMNESGETHDPAAELTPESTLPQVTCVNIKEEPETELSLL